MFFLIALEMLLIKKSYTTWKHGQLHCRGVFPSNPSKPPVVCLHMSPKSGRSYHEILPYLSNKERVVIAPDYPGHGESSLPPPDPHVTIEDFSEAIWCVIDDLVGEAPLHLIGHHTGSMVSVEMTKQKTDRVLSLINIAAPLFTDEELAEFCNMFKPIPIDEEGNRFRIMWERIMFHRGPGMTLQMCADSMAENLRAGDDYEWGHEAAFAYAKEYISYLSKIEQPVFVMNVNDDTYEHTKRIDPILNNGERIDYPQWGHGFLSAYPDKVAHEINKFHHKVEG